MYFSSIPICGRVTAIKDPASQNPYALPPLPPRIGREKGRVPFTLELSVPIRDIRSTEKVQILWIGPDLVVPVVIRVPGLEREIGAGYVALRQDPLDRSRPSV